jgi:hypothetical protein
MPAQMRLVGVLAGGIDHQEQMVAEIRDHQIVENAAALVRELRIALPSGRDGDHVLRHQPLQRACGVPDGAGSRAQRDLAHMRDVEQASGGAGMLVLPEHAGCVLYGHLVARERHHSGPKREMERVQGRAFRGRFVVACKHHGPSRVPRADSLRKPSKPHLSLCLRVLSRRRTPGFYGP